MRAALINAGNEYGGGLEHIVSLINELGCDQVDLIVFEEGPVAEAAREAGICVHVFQQKHRYEVKALYRLVQFIRGQNYAVIHTHGPRANTLIALVRPFFRASWIMTVHSDPRRDFLDRGLQGKAFETMHRLTFKKADGIIAVSNEIKNYLRSIGVPEERIKVIHNGIRFSKQSKPGVKRQSHVFTLITAGRLTEVKGNAILLRALSKVAFKDWRWIICGEGEELDELKRSASVNELTDHLFFKGWLTPSKLRNELRQADVFVLPSLSEGFPLVLLEAADEKVPVIATDVGDVKEVITDQGTGWLIPSDNEEALTEALTDAHQLWRNHQLADKGEQLKCRAKRFSIEKQTESVQKFYTEIRAENRR